MTEIYRGYGEGYLKVFFLFFFKVASATAVDWYSFLRDICIQYFIDHPAVIGGPGKEVEIDESKFGKRKYNKGRAVERGSGDSFLV